MDISTPGASGVEIGLPYPNPAGSGPVSIQLRVPTGSAVEWSVYTMAFRKILGNSGPIEGNNTTLVWDLKDKWGTRVANSLYFVKVQVKGTHPETKILKVLVKR